MPAYKRQLKDRNDDIIYPLTTAESVVDEDGVDLQTRVEDAAYIGTGSVGTLSPWVDTSDLVDGAVTTAKIATNAVTSSNIDFTSFTDTTLTLSDASPISGIVDYSSSFKFSCHKTKAGVAQLYLYIKNTSGSAIASYTNLLQLPEGYRPVARVHTLVNSSGGAIDILTNGYLQYSTSLSDGNGILATFCFLTS